MNCNKCKNEFNIFECYIQHSNDVKILPHKCIEKCIRMEEIKLNFKRGL